MDTIQTVVQTVTVQYYLLVHCQCGQNNAQFQAQTCPMDSFVQQLVDTYRYTLMC